eukprot:TRINITY_DN3206_c0_g1_i1.p3 TRINITY_DN3206_c0_g1~~TRINITY_DN3206_c0_g1_i1.p3  ORF type:complete len:162 (+),score=69.68 TRINITY_DN3206_c0_g1_i1:601-1086(+)
MVQINDAAQCRDLRRFKMRPVWEFFDYRQSSWLKFSPKMADILHDRLSKGTAKVELVIQGQRMLIDFQRMCCSPETKEVLPMRCAAVPTDAAADPLLPDPDRRSPDTPVSPEGQPVALRAKAPPPRHAARGHLRAKVLDRDDDGGADLPLAHPVSPGDSPR